MNSPQDKYIVSIDGIQIFADGANMSSITELSKNPLVRGFTTNPTLMRQAGVKDYLSFSSQVIEIIGERPISLEVFADDFATMRKEAFKLAGLGPRVFVKIPVTNTLGKDSYKLVKELASEGVQVNVTAVFTRQQIENVLQSLQSGPSSYVSVFAGRIADAGIDPIPTMSYAVNLMKGSKSELIWASPREVLNVVQAVEVGCHVITMTPDLIKKLGSLGRDLSDFSLDTVRMFARDAAAAGYQII